MTRRAIGMLAFTVGVSFVPGRATGQELQLHYDVRHALDPSNNPRNFPSIVFKHFKPLSFGSFLIKLEGDLAGERENLSKVYVELSQSIRVGSTPFYAHVGYSGGLGLFDGGSGGYTLDNAYLLGAVRPFRWKGGWGSAYIAYKRTNFAKASHDPQLSLYWGRALGPHWSFASTAVGWTQNRNHGDSYTAPLTGKRSALLMENEVWYRVGALFSVGSEVRVSRNVYATDGRLLVYPTLGVRYAF